MYSRMVTGYLPWKKFLEKIEWTLKIPSLIESIYFVFKLIKALDPNNLNDEKMVSNISIVIDTVTFIIVEEPRWELS